MVVPGGARLRDGLSHGVGIAIGRDAQNRCVVTRVLPGGAAAFSGQVGQRNLGPRKVHACPRAAMLIPWLKRVGGLHRVRAPRAAC